MSLRMTFATLLCVSCLWNACDPTAPRPTRPDPQAENVVYKGLLVMGAEAQYFMDCATKEDWWVEDRSGNGLTAQYRDRSRRPYQQVYAELRGELRSPPVDGFASEYQRVFVVKEIVSIRELTPENNCAE